MLWLPLDRLKCLGVHCPVSSPVAFFAYFYLELEALVGIISLTEKFLRFQSKCAGRLQLKALEGNLSWKSVITFQCTSDKNRCATLAVKTDDDNLHDDDILTPADLMTFAWQTAKGMVRAGCHFSCWDRPIYFKFTMLRLILRRPFEHLSVFAC